MAAPMRIDTQGDLDAGLAGLVAHDPRLAPVVTAAGGIPLRRQPPGYAGLAGIIVSQMVSKASADAIWSRLVAAACDPLTPAALLALSDDDCRQAGLSWGKRDTLRRAAEACLSGTIDLDAVARLPADDALAAMTAIKGIGPWTGEVYLLFCGGHPDVFPAGDVALQNAAAHALGLQARPKATELREMAEAWQPWRGVAARLLWAYYGRAMKRDVVPVEP
jgi:DNA-3-methyladenine glycosylase II